VFCHPEVGPAPNYVRRCQGPSAGLPATWAHLGERNEMPCEIISMADMKEVRQRRREKGPHRPRVDDAKCNRGFMDG
jgi:hypothetical protein